MDPRILDACLAAARLGVSADNGQPWKFLWRDGRLRVLLDALRAQSYFDCDRSLAHIGLGTVMENLAIASAHFGYSASIQVFPAGLSDNEPVAEISFTSGALAGHPLYPAIQARATNRKPYRADSVPLGVQATLQRSVAGWPGKRLVLIEAAALRRQIARLTAQVELIRFDFTCSDVHRDFFQILRHTAAEASASGDGLWVDCLEVDAFQRTFLRLLRSQRLAEWCSRIGLGRLFARQTISLLKHTPLIALAIGSGPWSAQRREDFIDSGRFWQRFWLVVTEQGLSCQPMATLPLFFGQHEHYGEKFVPRPASRTIEKCRREFDTEFKISPQEHLFMVFRVGYASPPSARSYRRPLKDLCQLEEESLVGNNS
jgi:nitroreductase